MMKPRYDTTQLKSHPKRNRKQNELVKTMLKHLDLMLGENHAGEFLAMFVELLKMAVNETPDKKLELRSMEIILNDYFHAKYSASGEMLFKVVKDHKKLKAFEVIKEKGLSTNELWFIKNDKPFEEYNETIRELYFGVEGTEKELKTKEEFDLLKEALR